MKAISIRQPWAWLIVNGVKNIENRSRRCHYRGPVLIHATKTVDWDAVEFLLTRFRHTPKAAVIGLLGSICHESRNLGAIVGRAEIVDCVDHSESPWFTGPWGLVLRNPEIITPIPWPGQQSVPFNVPDRLLVEEKRP